MALEATPLPERVSTARPGSGLESKGGLGWTAQIPWRFTIIVILPTLIACIYYLFIASPLYVSEAKFVVQQKDQPLESTGLGTLLSSVGGTAGQQEISAYEVQNYMMSRPALAELVEHHRFLDVVGRPEGDFAYRFPRPFERASLENLFNAYGRFVSVKYDTETGISTLRVEAFRPAEAREIASALLDQAEGWITRLNDRALADAVSQSQRQVVEAQEDFVGAQTALTTYRNKERLVDPDKSSLASLELIGKLQEQVASLTADRASLASLAPQSPRLPVYDRQIAAYNAQIDAERTRAAGAADSLAPKLAEFERLTLQRDVAGKTLEIAVAGLQTARLNAWKQQIFLNRVVSPTAPDKPTEPQKARILLMIFLSALMTYVIVSLVIAGLREHQQK